MIPLIHSSCAGGILASTTRMAKPPAAKTPMARNSRTTTAFMQALPPFPRLLLSDPSRALSTEGRHWVRAHPSPAFIVRRLRVRLFTFAGGNEPYLGAVSHGFFAGTSGAPKMVGGVFKPWPSTGASAAPARQGDSRDERA